MTNEVVEDCPPSCTGVSCVRCLRHRKGGCMKDHNFVPFNTFSFASNDNPFVRMTTSECVECFAPEEKVLEGFLGYGFSVGRNTFKIARFVLPTGCIQEVHVARGESALDAFHRWQKAATEKWTNVVLKWQVYEKLRFLSGVPLKSTRAQ